MSTALRPWLFNYITALPKPDVALPSAGSLQITDYSTEPPASPSALPRVTALVSDGHLRIRAPVDEAALRAVRDGTPLPQWRGAIVALDGWTLSYTADEFVLQLHSFRVLQAVGSSDIGSARHCMDEPQVRHTHALLSRVDTQQRHQLLLAQHAKLFPGQPLPPPSYSAEQPLPAEVAAAHPPSSELSFLYSVPEHCQRELDKLPPMEATRGQAAGASEASEAGALGLSQWSSGSDEADEKDQEYFSQYIGLRPPVPELVSPPAQSSARPLFPPLAPAALLTASTRSNSLSASPAAAVQPSSITTLAPQSASTATPSQLPLSRSTPHNPIYTQLSLTPSPPQPHDTQAPPSPALSVSSTSSSHAEEALHLPPASQHNVMETSLERDAMQAEELEASAGASAATPLSQQPSRSLPTSQLAQPRDDEHSPLPSQPLQPSQSSQSEEKAGAAGPFADDGFFMTQAPSSSEYASQLAASQAHNEQSQDSGLDLMQFELVEADEANDDAEAEEAAASPPPRVVGAEGGQPSDVFPASMPPLSPGPPSPNDMHEGKDESTDNREEAERKETAMLRVSTEAEREQRARSGEDGSSHFSAEGIARRQRERNAELLRQRQDSEAAAAELQRQQHESKYDQSSEEQVEVGPEHSNGTSGKRSRSAADASSGHGRPDKRRMSVRFDDNRNIEHAPVAPADEDGSQRSMEADESGQSLAELLAGVSMEEVASQPLAEFEGWSGADFVWHCSYWTAVQQ